MYCNLFHPNCAWKRSSKACIGLASAECTVGAPGGGQGGCPKCVEFYNRINLDN